MVPSSPAAFGPTPARVAALVVLLGAGLGLTLTLADGLEWLVLVLAQVLAASWLDRRGLVVVTLTAMAIPALGVFLAWSRAAESATGVAVTAGAALVGLGALAAVLDRLVVREREALAAAQRKAASLEQARARQAKDEQERANLERAVAQAQRLESLGRLAGSVAHDFNNLLAGIRGNVDLALMLEDRAQAEAALDTANAMVDRAAILTRNLLRFAKGQPVEVALVEVNALLRESEPIYQSLVPKLIRLRVQPDASRSTIRVNPAQLEQLILNLLVNASDAMPNGGELQIGTRDRDDGRLELFVADTGQGMSESIQIMIFQPFFTTKGKGTGIGLATVHDVVAAAGGEIQVDSAVGQGTRFCVLLRLHEPEAA